MEAKDTCVHEVISKGRDGEEMERERNNSLKLLVDCRKIQADLRGASFQFCELMCTKHTS